MLFALLPLLSMLQQCIMGAPHVKTNDVNVFLTLAQRVAGLVRPNSSCYVCSAMPSAAGEGLPLMAVPASDCDTCHLVHSAFSRAYSHPNCPRVPAVRPLNGSGDCGGLTETPKPVPILLVPEMFHWCLENDGERDLGESECQDTFKWLRENSGADFRSLNFPPDRCLEAAGATRLQDLAHGVASCSISSPVGMYWVCGNLAYPYLPDDYKGRCGLAYVVPAMRVVHSLPQKDPPRGDVFGTHPQSPLYRATSALDHISDLSQAVEDLVNETDEPHSELASVRLLAFQTRAAVDLLSAARTGTCTVIDSECCISVPGYNATIDGDLQETESEQNSWTASDWFSPLFGSTTYQTLKFLLILLGVLVFFSFFIPCMKRFLDTI